jgi:hypothetical protein
VLIKKKKKKFKRSQSQNKNLKYTHVHICYIKSGDGWVHICGGHLPSGLDVGGSLRHRDYLSRGDFARPVHGPLIHFGIYYVVIYMWLYMVICFLKEFIMGVIFSFYG